MDLVVGETYSVTVIRIIPHGAIVQLADGSTQLIHISNLSDRFVKDINEWISVGDTYRASCIAGKVHETELSLKGVQLSGPAASATPTRYVPSDRQKFNTNHESRSNTLPYVPKRTETKPELKFDTQDDDVSDTSQYDQDVYDRDRRRNRRDNKRKYQKFRKDW